MTSKNEKDREYLKYLKYLNKRNNMSPGLQEIFHIIVILGIDDIAGIANKKDEEYKKKSDDEQKKCHTGVRQQKKNMYAHFLGKNKYPRESRDREFREYIMKNDPRILHPRLKKKHDDEALSIPLEPDSFNSLLLKAKTSDGNKITLVDYLDEKCWDSKCLIKIKGSEKTVITTATETFIQLCQVRGVTKVIKIDFKYSLNQTILENAGSFMNWFMNKIYEQIDSENGITNEIYRKEKINKDPCNGSYEFMEEIRDKMDFEPEDNYLLIVIDNIDELCDRVDIAKVFYRYLGKVFQNIRRIRQVITYSPECYLKLNDLESPFNVGETLTLCEFDLEDIKRLLKEDNQKNNPTLSEEDIKIMLDWMGGCPYLWQVTIPYIRESEFKVEEFKKSAIANEDFLSFFYRICEIIKQDDRLMDSTKKLREPNGFLEEPEIIVSYVLEGLGVIKRDLNHQDRWIISGEIYRYFLKANIPINSNQKTERGDCSKTCSSIKVDRNGKLHAICKNYEKILVPTDFNLNEYIANINGNLEWSRKPEDNFAHTCKNCRVDFVINGDAYHGDAYLVCDCQRDDKSWNTTQLNLDERIDNTDGELRYYRQ